MENGRSNGVQILKKETIDIMCSSHLTASQRENSKLMVSRIFREFYGFGLGVAVVCKENKYGSIPYSGSIGSVDFPGAYGGWCSADPVKKPIRYF